MYGATWCKPNRKQNYFAAIKQQKVRRLRLRLRYRSGTVLGILRLRLRYRSGTMLGILRLRLRYRSGTVLGLKIKIPFRLHVRHLNTKIKIPFSSGTVLCTNIISVD